MFKLLIFGGTTEGRLLAEFCAGNGIPADISVATDYGAELLPDGVGVLSGRLDSGGITSLLQSGGYSLVVDATHPYAADATANITSACDATGTDRLRLCRGSSELSGVCVRSVTEAVELLKNCQGTILSTLGSKSVGELSALPDRFRRVWLRMLPADGIAERCERLGFDTNKLILEKGPFSVEQNIAHIRRCDARIVLTKESGAVGGYPEKAEAARVCGAQLITLLRPADSGFSCDELKQIIFQRWEENK